MNINQYSDLLLDQAKDLIWAVDKNLCLVYANRAYLKLMKEVTGVEKELNTPIFAEDFEEGDIEKWSIYYQRSLSGEFFETEEHFYNPKLKETQYTHIALFPLRNDHGEIQAVACRSTDITPLMKQKDHASQLMDASLDVFCTIDEDGHFVYVSAASSALWGYHPQELTGKPYRELIVQNDLEKTDLVAAEIMEGREFKSFSNRFRRKNGGIAYNLWSARWDHESKLMYCVARDEKEKIDEVQRLKLLEKVISNTSDSILITEAEPQDEPGPRIVYVNEAFTKMTGYTAEEVIGKSPRLLQGPDSDYQELKKLGEKLRRWESSEITVLNYTKAGKPFWVYFAVSPVANEKGWYTHWISVQRDVTEQKKQEAEKELLSQISLSFNNEDELIPAAKRLCENLYNFGKFDLIELWCPNMERTKLQLVGKSTQKYDFYTIEPSEASFHKNEGLQGKVWEKGKQLLWDESQINKYFVRKKGASHLGLQAILGLPLTFNDELVGVLLIGTQREPDYLEQHSRVLSRLEKFIGSEINRKRLEDDLKHLYQAIPDILCIADFNGRFLKMNPAGCELLGYPEEEILFHSFDEFVHPEDKVVSISEVDKLETDETTNQFENRYISKDGKVIWLNWSFNYSLQEGLIYASAKNITAEVQLRELNALAGSMAKIGSWEVDLEKSSIFWSEMVHQLHETDRDSFTPDFETSIKFYREDFRALVQSSFEKSITSGEGFDFEAVIITQKLKERWVRAIGNVEMVQGKATRIFGSFQDITDRKESELRLQSFANNLPGVAFQYYLYPDGTDDLKYVTSGATKVWGFDADSVMKDNSLVWKQIELGGELDTVKQSIMKSAETKSEWKVQWRYILPTNELRIHAGYGTPTYLPDKTIVFNSLILDITQEHRSEELLEQASDMAKIGSWELNLSDPKNDSMYWSPMTREILEVDDSYNPSLTGGFEFYEAESKLLIQNGVEQLIETGTPFDLELMIHPAKGHNKWIRCIGKAEFIEGKCVRIFGSFQDIHDRKKYVEALRESEAKFRTIFEIASLGIAQVSPEDGQILLVNSYYEEITGYSHEEMLQMKFLELTHPDDRERDWDLFSKAAKGEIEYRNEKRYIRKDGSIVWVRIHLAFIRDQEGNPVKTVAICENITDRKEIESQLVSLSDNIPGVVFQYLLFPDGTDALRSVSKGARQLWGYSPEQVENDINLVWDQIKAGGEYEQVKKDILEAVRTKSKWFSRYKSILPTGDVRTSLGSGLPTFLADGTVLFNSFILDVTKEAKYEALHSEAIQMARIGSWEVNLHNNKVIWSEITHQLHETDPASFKPDLETSINFYREDFREVVKSRVKDCIENGAPFDFEAVIVTAKNNERWVRALGQAEMMNGECMRIHGSFQDINEAKLNELKLQEILDSISDAFYAVDSDWNFTYFNKEAENLLGKKANEVLGKCIWEVFSPAKGTILEEIYRRVASTGQSENFEYYYPGNGSWYEITTYPSVGGIASYFKNIDERRKAAQELEKAYKEKNQILESISDAFFAIDDKWTVTYWNKQAETVLNRLKEDIVGKNLWDEFPDAVDTDFYVQYHRAMETGETVQFEEYYPTLDIWIEVTVYPSESGLSIYFKDITLRKEADIRLLNANERFELVTKATNDAIWDWDIENDDLYRSENIHKILGIYASTKLSKSDFWEDAFHPEDLVKIKKSIQQALNDPLVERWEMEYRVFNQNDEELSVIDRGIIVRNKEGKAIRMVGAMTDLSKQKKLEKELFQVNASLKNHARELERSNEELEQFAFITSHDLQEPLRMITSFMDQLKRKYSHKLDDKAHQYIYFATDGAKRMKQIIQDLLLYSRANRPLDHIEEVNLNDIIAEYTQLRRRLIAEKNASIDFDALPVLDTYRAPVTQILHSLLDNALRYAKENEPARIKIDAIDKETEWEFAVSDNGIGIDEMFFDKIFIIFQRLHNRNKHDGTGIGLSIAKRSVEFLGGDIWLESTVGEGSTFYFTISKKNENYTI